ncbi:MAG: TlpA family protein disulfide reductase [Marmoricola sp.]
MRRLLVGMLLIAATLTGCGKDLTTPGQEQSDRLPDVTLAGFAGHPDVDLGTFKGPAVINLFASWCPPCKRELPLYAQFARAHTGVQVLGINFRETDDTAAEALLTRSGVAFPVVRDTHDKIVASGLPKLILVDATGKVVLSRYVEIKTRQQLEDLVARYLGVTL